MLDGGAAADGPGDGDDVETGAAFEQIVPLHVGEGQTRQSLLLGFVNCVCWVTGVVRGPRFDLNEDDGAAIDGNQVELADIIAMTAGDDDVAQAAKVTGSGIFTAAPERLGR